MSNSRNRSRRSTLQRNSQREDSFNRQSSDDNYEFNSEYSFPSHNSRGGGSSFAGGNGRRRASSTYSVASSWAGGGESNLSFAMYRSHSNIPQSMRDLEDSRAGDELSVSGSYIRSRRGSGDSVASRSSYRRSSARMSNANSRRGGNMDDSYASFDYRGGNQSYRGGDQRRRSSYGDLESSDSRSATSSVERSRSPSKSEKGDRKNPLSSLTSVDLTHIKRGRSKQKKKEKKVAEDRKSSKKKTSSARSKSSGSSASSTSSGSSKGTLPLSSSTSGTHKSQDKRGKKGLSAAKNYGVACRPVLSWKENFRVLCLASSAGGRIFSGGDPSGGISVWDSRTGQREYIIEGHEGPVLALATLPNMDVLLSGGYDGTVRLFSIRTLQNVLVMSGHTRLVTAVACATDGVGLAIFSGSDDGTVRQWCAITGNCLHVYTGHKGPINALCCIQDVKQIISGGEDGTLRLWSVTTHKKVAVVTAYNNSPVYCMVPLEIDRIATGGSEQRKGNSAIRIWAIPLHQAPYLLREIGVVNNVRSMLNYRQFLFATTSRGELFLWNLQSNNVKATLMFHTRRVTGITLENNKLCTSSLDHCICRWNVQNLLGVDMQPVVPYVPLLSGISGRSGEGGIEFLLGGLDDKRLSSKAKANRALELRGKKGKASNTMLADRGEAGGNNGNNNNGPNGAKGIDERGKFAFNNGVLSGKMGEYFRITPAETALLHQELPLNFIVSQLKNHKLDLRWCFDLLLFIVLLVCFTLLHAVFTTVHSRLFIDEGIESQLTNMAFGKFRSSYTYSDIDSADRMFEWLDLVVTNLWADRVSNSSYPALPGYNILLGSFNVQVQRVDRNSCKWDRYYLPPESNGYAPCFANSLDMLKNPQLRGTSPFICPCSTNYCLINTTGIDPDNHAQKYPRVMETYPEECANLPNGMNCSTGFVYNPDAGVNINKYGKGGYGVDLYYSENGTQQRKYVEALHKLGFIDDLSTRYVAVHIYTYNPNLDIFLSLHYTLYNMAVGYWDSEVQVKGFEVFNSDTMASKIALYVIVFVVTIISLVSLVIQGVKAFKKKKGIKFVARFWLLLDVTLYVLLLVSIGYFFRWIQISKKLDIIRLIKLSSPARLEDLKADQVNIREKLQEVSDSYAASNIIASVCAAIIYGKCLRFVTECEFGISWHHALRYLRYLSFIPLLLFCVFALLGSQALYLLFSDVKGFTSFGSTYHTLMHAFVGGYFLVDYKTLFRDNRIVSAIVFIAYNLIFQVLISSLFFVVIIESLRVANRARGSTPLYVAVHHFFRRAKARAAFIRYKFFRRRCLNLRGRICCSDSPAASGLSVRQLETVVIERLLNQLKYAYNLKHSSLNELAVGKPNRKVLIDSQHTDEMDTMKEGGDSERQTSRGTSSTTSTAAAHPLFNVMNLGSNRRGRRAPSHQPSMASDNPLETTFYENTARSLDTNSSSHMVGTLSCTRSNRTANLTSMQRAIKLNALQLRQADLLSILSNVVVDEESELEWRMLDEEEDVQMRGGLSTVSREIIAELWERMTYEYHFSLLYSDPGKEEDVTEELQRVTTALDTMSSLMTMVSDTQKSLDTSEGVLRPLVKAMETTMEFVVANDTDGLGTGSNNNNNNNKNGGVTYNSTVNSADARRGNEKGISATGSTYIFSGK